MNTRIPTPKQSPYFAFAAELESLTKKWVNEDFELAMARSGLPATERNDVQEQVENDRVNAYREEAIKELLIKHFQPNIQNKPILVLP